MMISVTLQADALNVKDRNPYSFFFTFQKQKAWPKSHHLSFQFVRTASVNLNAFPFQSTEQEPKIEGSDEGGIIRQVM